MQVNYLLSARDLIDSYLFFKRLSEQLETDKSLQKELESEDTKVGRKIYISEMIKFSKHKTESLKKILFLNLLLLEDKEFINQLFGEYDEKTSYQITLLRLAEKIEENKGLGKYGYWLSNIYFIIPDSLAYLLFSKEDLHGFSRESNSYVYDTKFKDRVKINDKGDIEVYLKWNSITPT